MLTAYHRSKDLLDDVQFFEHFAQNRVIQAVARGQDIHSRRDAKFLDVLDSR